jgi:prepilin-type N-terminal cleavage/methylation domain-containing protein
MYTMNRHRAAFTLVEMMVVLTIILVLLLILGMPLLNSAVRTGYIASCASNENQLYVAAQAYRIEHRKPLSADQWQPNLLPYMQNSREVFYCPEDENPYADSLVKASLSIDVYDCEYTNYRGTLPLYEWSRPIGFGGGTQGWKRKDIRENVYELWMEDGWNKSWNDLLLQIDESQDGQVTITYVGENTGGGRCTGWRYSLLDPSGAKIEPLDDMGGNAKITKSQLGDSVTLLTDEGDGSYGINFAARSGFAGYDQGKWIMFLDYYKLQADVGADDWAEELTTSGTHGFARHLNGICNVLTMDGSIRQQSSFDIDPTFVEHIDTYWQPVR